MAAPKLLTPVFALVLALSGCSGPDSTVPLDAESASVSAGETLRIDFGKVNPSVGDSWYLVEEPDAAVLTEVGRETRDDPDCDGDGCGIELAWDFEAVGPGETTLVFQYCFRTDLEECVADPEREEPVELTVTVTD
ncbi:protease inhibitor I42 family protein [Glycomyces sp. NRRL B-16210]|uniref:protease inhibitor I42 family protein n=1 Tax=Glycomyces sp. NRRL B-16210 TaxID=1463821 RepID=UPI0009DD0B0B|nr:protease inhibitor I42 family protein [Glycomyces sp. NRRL B-16210]